MWVKNVLEKQHQSVLLNVLFCAAGIPLSATDFAEIYKVDDPKEQCQVEEVKPDKSCGNKVHFSSHSG